VGQTPRTLGVVGLGTVAEPHIEAYLQLDCVEITGLAEPCARRREEVSARFGLPSFESCTRLLAAAKPDIICVLTPAGTHRQIVEESARAGAHVLCEKPMAHTLEDAFAMERACRQHSVRFCYGSSYRHLPAVMQARRLIAEGEIGAVRLLVEEVVTGEGESSFQPLSATHYPLGGPGGGGYGLVDHGIHMLDILPWLCDSSIATVFGRGDRSGAPARPEFAILGLTSGALGVLLYDGSTWPLELPSEGLFSAGREWIDRRGWVGPRGLWDSHPGNIRVYGSKGSLRIYHYANRLLVNRDGGLRECELPRGATPEHFGAQMRHFCQELNDGADPSCGSGTGVRTLAALFAIYDSERCGTWQTLSPPPRE
jgi:UDP-N-acetyl-2-amino-2-deoxyglucuronate dehydrogenase